MTREATTRSMREKLGICQWFHYEDHEAVHQTLALMEELGLKHLRTGISWADFHRPDGEQWYDWQMKMLRDADIEVLLSIWHTPPSISEGDHCASPPRRLADYGDFVGQVLDTWDDCFEAVELWNEPNNLYKWNFRQFDPGWTKFARMITAAARQAKQRSKLTVLGGIIPVDPDWLWQFRRHGSLEDLDVVAIHGFPQMWWPDRPCWDQAGNWHGWQHKVDLIEEPIAGRPIWITETGLATWDMERRAPGRWELQVRQLGSAAEAPVERVYWYSLIDLDPVRPAIEGFHVDENEYHLGLVTHEGKRKPAFEQMRQLLSSESVEASAQEDDLATSDTGARRGGSAER